MAQSGTLFLDLISATSTMSEPKVLKKKGRVRVSPTSKVGHASVHRRILKMKTASDQNTRNFQKIIWELTLFVHCWSQSVCMIFFHGSLKV